MRVTAPVRQDVVVPRVYLEPDERLDRLRVCAWRWAIARDVLAVIIGLYLVGVYVVRPLISALT